MGASPVVRRETDGGAGGPSWAIRARWSRETRARIYQSALEHFLEHGYHDASVDDIARRADVSVGTIYHHFGGKQALAAHLWVHAVRSYQERFEALGDVADGEAFVRALVRTHFEWTLENPLLARYLSSGRDAEVIGATREEATELNDRLAGRIHDWAKRYGDDIAPVPRRMFWAVVLGPAHAYARECLNRAGGDPAALRRRLRRGERHLADAAWNAVRARDA